MKVTEKRAAKLPAQSSAEPKRDAAWAQKTLIAAFGVPSDLLGEPRFEPQSAAIMVGIVTQMAAADRRALREAAVGLKMSDYSTMQRILPRSYERELIKIIDRLG